MNSKCNNVTIVSLLHYFLFVRTIAEGGVEDDRRSEKRDCCAYAMSIV